MCTHTLLYLEKVEMPSHILILDNIGIIHKQQLQTGTYTETPLIIDKKVCKDKKASYRYTHTQNTETVSFGSKRKAAPDEYYFL